MAIQLKKGGNVSLSKHAPNLKKIVIALGWDSRTSIGADFDLDAGAFMLNGDGMAISDDHFIFYNNLNSPDGSIQHLGDNLDGSGDGDDEMINVSLDEVPAVVQKVVLSVTIYEGEERNQNFGMVSNAFIRIINQDTSEEIARYDLGEDFSMETAMIFGELYRYNGEWKFRAVGQGIVGGLAAIVQRYGIETSDSNQSCLVI